MSTKTNDFTVFSIRNVPEDKIHLLSRHCFQEILGAADV